MSDKYIIKIFDEGKLKTRKTKNKNIPEKYINMIDKPGEYVKLLEKKQTKRAPTQYNLFVQKHRKAGKSMKEIGQMWKNK